MHKLELWWSFLRPLKDNNARTFQIVFNLHPELLLASNPGAECTSMYEITPHWAVGDPIPVESIYTLTSWQIDICGQIDHVSDHSWSGHADKWSESLVRKRGSGDRQREREGWDFQVGHTGGVDLHVQWALQDVWLIRNDRAFEGLDVENTNLVVVYLLNKKAQAFITLTVVCGLCCTLCPSSLWGICGDLIALSTREVGQLSAIPCMQKQTCSKSLPEASAKKKDCVPLSPFPLRNLHDCIDLSWFHSARGSSVKHLSYRGALTLTYSEHLKELNFHRIEFDESTGTGEEKQMPHFQWFVEKTFFASEYSHTFQINTTWNYTICWFTLISFYQDTCVGLFPYLLALLSKAADVFTDINLGALEVSLSVHFRYHCKRGNKKGINEWTKDTAWVHSVQKIDWRFRH